MRFSPLASLLIPALLGALAIPAQSQVYDEGQVEIDLDGNVAIGNTAFGRRTVTGVDAGELPSATIGRETGGQGELLLVDGAEVSITGSLGAGGFGRATVDVSGGSSLRTGAAKLIDVSSPPSNFSLETTSVTVRGLTSSWVNDGIIEVGRSGFYAGATVSAVEGGRIETEGLIANSRNVEFGRASILVDGFGSSWLNTGSLLLYVDADLTVANGGVASSARAEIGSSYYRSRALVTGAGSLWDIDDFYIGSASVPLMIQAGGRVESKSVFMSTQTAQEARVRGAGSTWVVEERLRIAANDAGGNSTVSVIEGGFLDARDVHVGVGGGGTGLLRIVDPGSSARISNELALLAGSYLQARVHVSGGATIMAQSLRGECQGDRPSTYGGCEISVLGEGSALIVANGATFAGGPIGTATGIWRVGDGGRVEVGETLTIEDGAELRVETGTVEASLLSLRDGILSGTGTVMARVESGGSISPGASAGHLAIHGDLTMASDSTLQIELGGLAAGTEHDLLSVLGTSVLGGTLRVALIDGFMPTLGDVFDVMSADVISGAFDAYEGMVLAPGRRLEVALTPTGMRLVTVPEAGTAALVSIGIGLLGTASRATRRRPGR